MIYIVETYFGLQLIQGKNIVIAANEAIKDCGKNNFKSIREAADSDIAWVKGMGGYVPKDGE